MTEGNLRASAKAGLLWGVGFTLARDVLQFLTMIVLVRLLSPEIYGQQALAQTIIGFIAVASLKTLSQYPLQARDPDEFDWDTQFSVGVVLNTFIFGITCLIGLGLMDVGGDLATVGLVVIALSPVFLVEIFSTHELCWLQAQHDWKRLRSLLLVGSLIASAVGVTLAWLNAGVFALAVMPSLLGGPLALHLILFSRRVPRFSPALLARYAEGVRFGANRALSSVAYAGRNLGETIALSSVFGFASLGSYNRAVGLAQITSGRVGPVATQTLYPILTRAEASSARFRRFAALLLQGVTWVSVPAAAFLAIEAHLTVRLLYGDAWDGVIRLLPMAALVAALRSMSATLNQIMLANLQARDCVRLDLAAVVLGFASIAVAMNFGVIWYLAALVICEVAVLISMVAIANRGDAISLGDMLSVIMPPLGGAALATLVITALPSLSVGVSARSIALSLLLDGILFSSVYLMAVFLLAPKATVALLDMLPMSKALRSFAPSASGESRKSPND